MSGAVQITRLDLSTAELRKLAKRQTKPLIVRRMLAISLVLEGVDRQTAARSCGMDRQTLRDWVHHYNAEGIAGLRERRTSGHKSPLGAREKAALSAMIEAGPDPEVHHVVRWRRVDLRDELKTQFGVEVHERTVGKYLAELGYRRLSVRPQHPDSDPAAQEAFKKTSPKSSAQHSPKKPVAKLSKSGFRMKPASASKAP
jgi:transposase